MLKEINEVRLGRAEVLQFYDIFSRMSVKLIILLKGFMFDKKKLLHNSIFYRETICCFKY